jgi:hypothetical protein
MVPQILSRVFDNMHNAFTISNQLLMLLGMSILIMNERPSFQWLEILESRLIFFAVGFIGCLLPSNVGSPLTPP